MENQGNIQKFLRSELSFYITLIGAVLTIAGFYFGLSNQINLIAQKMEIHLEQTGAMPEKIAQMSEEIAILKTNQNR
jgi:hypothetical protein